MSENLFVFKNKKHTVEDIEIVGFFYVHSSVFLCVFFIVN